MPLSTEQLIQTIENNQSTIMFQARGVIAETILRNSNDQLARFGRALDKYPPVYESELPNGREEILLAAKKTHE
jgi:hypothetical protein